EKVRGHVTGPCAAEQSSERRPPPRSSSRSAAALQETICSGCDTQLTMQFKFEIQIHIDTEKKS
ncbi:hypothetical protein C0J52_07481, partial [Blattella germanica]